MGSALVSFVNSCRGGRVLLALAAPSEARAALAALGAPAELSERPWTLHAISPRFDLIVTGVGKVNAGGAVAKHLDPARHAAVLSMGIAGALPHPSRPPLGACIVASASVYADEGLQTPTAFLDCSAMGFPLGPFEGGTIVPSPALLSALSPLADIVGSIATVSTCSGTDALAEMVARRTGGVAEAMEGASIAHVAARLGVPAGEVRIISNTTGDRPGQRWDLKGGLARLEMVIARL